MVTYQHMRLFGGFKGAMYQCARKMIGIQGGVYYQEFSPCFGVSDPSENLIKVLYSLTRKTNAYTNTDKNSYIISKESQILWSPNKLLPLSPG